MINPYQNLIMVKGEDKTASIDSWKYCNGSYTITFLGGKTYTYNYHNVMFYKNPSVIDLNNTMVLKHQKPLFSVEKVLIFERYAKIFYENGYQETVKDKELTYIDSILSFPKSKDCFEYLKQIAIVTGLTGEDGRNILASRYEKIDFIRMDSILGGFLSGNLEGKTTNTHQILYPFGFNLSQKEAVQNAIANKLSIIEGPPGTGKTQTILNIIANALVNGQSVAVVSSNNSATQNVMEKLQKYGIGFVVAYLGNGTNKKEFIENQRIELPDFSSWVMEKEVCESIGLELIELSKQLDEMLVMKNRLSNALIQRQAIETEYRYYMQYYEETNENDKEMVIREGSKADRILELLVAFENEEQTMDTILNYIRYYIKYGIRKRAFLRNSQDRKIAICQKYFYELKLRELSSEIDTIEQKLKGFDFEQKMAYYSEKSLLLLKSKLANKYGVMEQRTLYELEDLWKHSDEFIRDYPIILSTTYSLRSSLSSSFVYDYVIVDEASQVDLATGALALSCAKKAVIVGDLKQLPNVVPSQVKKRTDEIFERFSLKEAYRYSNHSLLQSIRELFVEAPHTLLREHYRCHPKIIEYCNQKFYDGELIILTPLSEEREPLVVYKTVEGNHKRDKINVRQIDVITKEVIPQQNLDVMKDSIGIVTPYRMQADQLQGVFKGTMVKADTVDKFQGQECDTIILSTVDDEITDFADDANRLNVAVSRAVEQLIVVTDGNNTEKNSNLKDLIEYIEYNNFEVIESKIYSIFDYLYRSYNNKRIQYLKDKKQIGRYDSENLMYTLIQGVLHENESFHMCDVAVHVPLRMILRDVETLEEAEIQYVMAPGTHVDFVIYSKISKKLLLIIEVDGYQFHKEGSKQADRDKVKNKILDLYQLSFVRFRTNGSGEREVIEQQLLKQLGVTSSMQSTSVPSVEVSEKHNMEGVIEKK